MNQVLDEIETKSTIKKTFSKLSFSFAFITISLIIYALTIIPKEIAVKDVFMPLSTEFIYANYAMILSSIIGLTMTIISFIKNEPTTIIKWIGGVINTSISIFYIGRLIFHKW